MSPNKFVDYYEILQVSPSAEPEVIEAAYKVLAQKYHPDVNQSPTAAERMKEINVAHDILSNSARRRQFHVKWQQGNEGKTDTTVSNIIIRPKPVASPPCVRFTNMEPGQIRRASFVIDNQGGTYTSISVSNPHSWLRVATWNSIISKGKLPLEIEIEARALDWGKTGTEYIKFKLDSEEAIVTVELQMKPKPERIYKLIEEPKRDRKFKRKALYTSIASVTALIVIFFLLNLLSGVLLDKINMVTAIQSMKEPATLITSNLTKEHLALGNSYSGQNRWNEAIAEYNKAIELDPKNAIAYQARGDVFANKRDYDKAMSDYTRAIEINPQYAACYCSRGVASANKGDYDKAIIDYTAAIELNPQYIMAYHYRGFTYSWKGDYDKAIFDYTRIIELNPKDEMAYYYLGVAHSWKGEYAKAIFDYTRVIELDPQNGAAYRARGDVYAKKGDDEKAKADLKKSTELGYK